MNSKPLIILGMVIGSTVGGYLPTLWDAGIFSISGIIGSFVGGIIGIWAAYQIAQRI